MSRRMVYLTAIIAVCLGFVAATIAVVIEHQKRQETSAKIGGTLEETSGAVEKSSRFLKEAGEETQLYQKTFGGSKP